MLFAPSVRASLLTMPVRQIYRTTCKETILLCTLVNSGQPKIDLIMKVQKCSSAHAEILDNLIVGLIIHNL